jgi:teichoic acid transport system ATP-binding protein
MASKKAAESRRPVVIVDDVDVVYRVYTTGKRAGAGAGRASLLAAKEKLRVVRAVKSVSFTVYEGETVGIIGSNGSGKSSLMRAIAGLVRVESGRVFAESRPTLLSVGAALIPELSGERNILLGGMALGSSRKEMVEAVDSIAEFAGLEEFIDMPMRTYSAGMAARLRFSIAARKDHEILIIDEALAVGDKQFRNRSEARVREMRDNAGAVFLVSHSMSSIRETCNRVIWLEKGELRMDGEPAVVTTAYTKYMEALTPQGPEGKPKP